MTKVLGQIIDRYPHLALWADEHNISTDKLYSELNDITGFENQGNSTYIYSKKYQAFIFHHVKWPAQTKENVPYISCRV